jgi:C4-dicarboxylate-specific signal transduction histidine kinase
MFPLLKGLHERIAADTTWGKLFEPPYRHQFDERTMTAHGWRCISWAAKAVRDEDSGITQVVAVGRDITEQRRSEEQDRQHVNELAHVTRLSSMSEMGSALAHELNQPLASILSYSQACLRLSAVESCDMAELRAALERVAKNAERAGDIMRHIQDFVRKDVSRRTSVDVNYLVREVRGLANMEARQSDIELTLDLDEDISPIEVDAIQLQQVILNLFRNAMDSINAGPSGKRSVLTETIRRSGDAVEIAISDTGSGIAPEIAESLFEPFVTTKENGMGIGLSISRSIIEAHGGRLSVSPNSDGGATFRITLPATIESAASVT